MTTFRKFVLTAAAALIVAAGSTGIAAARDRDHDGRRDHGWAEHHDRDGYHDRYWKPGFRGYVAHDRVYVTLRGHGYHRWAGAPYWHHGHYVIRTYDRRGRVIFVEVNPYTAAFMGVIRF